MNIYTNAMPKRLRTPRASWFDLAYAYPWVICVQVVHKMAGSKGLKMDLSNAESATDSCYAGNSGARRFFVVFLT
jgi:hypothetical protein